MDNNDKKLFNGLLKADGIDPEGVSDDERAVYREMLDREMKLKSRLSRKSVAAIWIFVATMFGLCLYEKIPEALRIPFVISCLSIQAIMCYIFISRFPLHTRKLNESNRKISKLHFLVHGKHRGIAIVSRKDGKRVIHWPRLIALTIAIWLLFSLGGAGGYYLLCQRWIYSSGSIFHIFLCTVMSLSFTITLLRDGLKAPLDELVEVKEKPKQSKSGLKPEIWRIIMKSKITKYATVAVIIATIFIGMNQFGNSSMAFADILTNIQNAKTLSWKTTITVKGQSPKVTHIMALEPYNMRVEFEDGKVWILDHSIGKTLVLEPNRKLAVVSSTVKKHLDIYNTFKNFQNTEGFVVEEIGQKQIDGKSSIGFRLTKKDKSQEIMVWAELETKRPILIEQTTTDGQSRIFHTITNEIVFDVELDEALFNIEPPERYKKQFMDGPLEHATQMTSRVQSAENMNNILKTCLNYVEINHGKWPNSIDDFAKYELDPECIKGYVYLKPKGHLSPSDIILYEAYETWGSGLNAGFADGHIEFIKKESDFKKRLLK